MDTYRIGDLARGAGVTVRTVRYYEDLGLLKTHHRTDGGQRTYTDADLIYLKRIIELKELDFSLDEIKSIIALGPTDKDGAKRREELLRQYRYKLSEAMEMMWKNRFPLMVVRFMANANRYPMIVESVATTRPNLMLFHRVFPRFVFFSTYATEERSKCPSASVTHVTSNLMIG